MGTRAFVAALGIVALAGCKQADVGAGAGAASSVSAAAATAADPPTAATPTAAPTPVAVGLPEVATATFFRAAGGTATFAYPELDEARWKVTLDRSAGFPRIDHAYTSGGARALLQVMFPGRADADLQAEPVARAAAAELAKAVGGTVEAGKPLGPSAYVVRVRATPGQVEVVSAVLASVDGRAAALIVATGTEASMQRPEFQAAYKKVIQGVRVGRQIPHPPPHDPGTPLAGVFLRVGTRLGEYDALIFDPSGYVHDRDELTVDVDAVWSIRAGALDRYTFDGRTVTVVDGKGGRTSGTLTGDELAYDGERRFCRSNGKVPARIEGHWEAAVAPYVNSNAYETFTFSSSADYYFGKDGTFSFESFVNASSTTTQGSPSARTEVHSQGADRSRGTYQIAGDRLTTRFADGTSVTKPIYARSCGGDGLGLLFIGGQMYLQDD